MNVSAAKAPFKFDMITDMMLNLGKASGCAHKMAFDKSTSKKPNHLSQPLRHFVACQYKEWQQHHSHIASNA